MGNTGKRYSLQTKLEAVEYYNNNVNVSMYDVCSKYNISITTCKAWRHHYEAGNFNMDKAGSVLRRPNNPITVKYPSDSKDTITINGVTYVPYTKPSEVMNINGVDYVKVGV